MLYSKVPYDPVKDFAPVAQCLVYQYVLVTLAGAPYRSIAELVGAARANPGALSYGSTGVGGGNHLAGELLALATGARLNHVPYKGSAEDLALLIRNELQQYARLIRDAKIPPP